MDNRIGILLTFFLAFHTERIALDHFYLLKHAIAALAVITASLTFLMAAD
jgi:hypothetical protein